MLSKLYANMKISISYLISNYACINLEFVRICTLNQGNLFPKKIKERFVLHVLKSLCDVKNFGGGTI